MMDLRFSINKIHFSFFMGESIISPEGIFFLYQSLINSDMRLSSFAGSVYIYGFFI